VGKKKILKKAQEVVLIRFQEKKHRGFYVGIGRGGNGMTHMPRKFGYKKKSVTREGKVFSIKTKERRKVDSRVPTGDQNPSFSGECN